MSESMWFEPYELRRGNLVVSVNIHRNADSGCAACPVEARVHHSNCPDVLLGWAKTLSMRFPKSTNHAFVLYIYHEDKPIGDQVEAHTVETAQTRLEEMRRVAIEDALLMAQSNLAKLGGHD